MQSLIELAKVAPLTAFVLVCSAYYLAKCILWMPYNILQRCLRHRAIMRHGWPTPPMDADGDVIYPDCEDETDEDAERVEA